MSGQQFAAPQAEMPTEDFDAYEAALTRFRDDFREALIEAPPGPSSPPKFHHVERPTVEVEADRRGRWALLREVGAPIRLEDVRVPTTRRVRRGA